jgi:hypothetical protein
VIALPTSEAGATFHHYPELPALDRGVGSPCWPAIAGPPRGEVFSPLGLDPRPPGQLAELPLSPEFERGVMVLKASSRRGGRRPGALYFGTGRDRMAVERQPACS